MSPPALYSANEPTVAKRGPVDKDTYVAWEREVIKAFYTPEHKVTDLFPRDDLPAFVSMQKYILVLLLTLTLALALALTLTLTLTLP